MSDEETVRNMYYLCLLGYSGTFFLSYLQQIMNRVALVTGASSKIGRKVAQELNSAGFKVFAAARRVDRMEDLKREGITPVSLDLTKDNSIVECVQEVTSKAGNIDILVNNAGCGSFGAIEDVPLEEGRRQFETNLFGMTHLIQLVTPGMREKHYGRIVNVSPIDGKIWTAFGGWYNATKSAVDGILDCLRVELEPFGIDVVIVDPDGIKTDGVLIAAENLKMTSGNGAYAEIAYNYAGDLSKKYRGNMFSNHDKIARTIRKAVTCRHPNPSYKVYSGYYLMDWLRYFIMDFVYDLLINWD